MVSRSHGGRLVDRVAKDRARDRLVREVMEMPRIGVDSMMASDIANIAHGVYSPLEGFLTREDYLNVLAEGRLSDDVPWTIPIILDVAKEEIAGLREDDEVGLWQPIAVLDIEETYGWSRDEFAQQVFGTRDTGHPGVRLIAKRKDVLWGARCCC